MTLDLVTAPADEPVTLEQMKAWVRQDSSDDDALIKSLISMAREAVENYLNRALVTQTWDLWLDAFRDIEIPKAPLQSVTAITYTDDAGATQTVATSVYDVFAYLDAPGWVRLAYSQSWPSTRAVKDAVKIRFVAGYPTVSPLYSNIPQAILHGIKVIAAEYYENREINVVNTRAQIVAIPGHVERLLWPYKVHGFGA